MEYTHGKNSFSESYANAGVDITAGYRSVDLIKPLIAKTATEGSIGNIGGFGGLFLPNLANMRKPTLVSGTDGVGTKLKIAMLMDKHGTIGIDCVAMCVNDIICCGAKPLYFLDYIACGKNYPEKIAAIVSGIAEGCIQADCALIGGETAEHPGVMPPHQYDVAGFAVGIVDRDNFLKPETQQVGDVLIGLPSSGVHSNGFSLIRKIYGIDDKPEPLYRKYDKLDGRTLGEVLLTPTTIYVKPILSLLSQVPVKAISHITGGGFYENIPRNLPKGLTALIKLDRLKIPPIFRMIQRDGKVPEHDMFNTFNMGIGMIVSVPPEYANTTVRLLKASDTDAYIIGELIEGDDGVIIKDSVTGRIID